jgi:hypothetical protein
MTENIEPPIPTKEKIPLLPIIVLALVGLGLTIFCIFGIVLNRTPLFASATPTSQSTPESTPEYVIPPTPDEDIQAVSTQSLNTWGVVISDTFDSNENIWYVGESSTNEMDSNLEIKDGKYLWDIKSKANIITSIFPTLLQPVRDFHASADLKLTQGRYRCVYGLIFRADAESGGGYIFGIYGDRFVVFLNDLSTENIIIDSTRSAAILPQETNRLTVIGEGNHFLLFINNQYVGEFTDNTFKEGVLGFALWLYEADLENSFEFDNFEVRVP